MDRHVTSFLAMTVSCRRVTFFCRGEQSVAIQC